MPRKNKSKKEIVSDIQLVQDADRRRALIKDVVFPYLGSLDESIEYAKIFLQAFSSVIEGVYEENRKKITVGDLQDKISEKLLKVFSISDPEQKKEYERYANLVSLTKEVSVQDLAYAAQMPRFIDGWLMKDSGKAKMSTVPINEILG